MRYFPLVGENEIHLAVKNLKVGNLVIFPTETVYGIGADAENEFALLKVFKIKKRPLHDPLIVHVGSPAKVEFWAKTIPDCVHLMIEKLWPGPITFVLRKKPNINKLISAGMETIAVRNPNSEIAIRLLRQFEENGGNGIAAPSANLFSQVSPTDTSSVIDGLGERLGLDDFVLEGGDSPIGIESTILDCSTNEICLVRPGVISEEEIREYVPKLKINENSKINLPGNFLRHYSPRAKVILSVAQGIPPGQWVLALKGTEFESSIKILDSPSNLKEFARTLYKNFRKADKMGIKILYVIPPEPQGIGFAILDRLIKAAGD